ncbi:hypothetical protein B0H17DRAFT_874541, partial [Mycena rosella]
YRSASSMTPATKVFCSAPLTKGSPSRMVATANRDEGGFSEWDTLIAARRLSMVSFT